MGRFTRQEGTLVATAALLVFSRVFGLSLVMPNFRGHYEGLAPVIWIGVAFGAHGLTMAIMQLPWGLLSDRIGRRPVLLVSSACFVAGSVLAAFADTLPLLLAGRLLQGMGAIASVAMAAVGETIPAERRTFAMAMVGIPAGMGFLLGMALGPTLYPSIGMQGLFLVTAALGLVAALPLLGLHVNPAKGAAPGPALSAPVFALAAAGFCMNYALTTTLFFLPDDDARSLLPMLVIALLVVGVASRRIDKAGWTWQPVAVGLLALPVAAAAFALGPMGAIIATGAVFFSGHAILSTVLPSQVSRIAGPSGGRGHGIQNVVAYSGTFAAGAVGGALAGAPWGAFAILAALAAVACVLIVRHLR